MSIRLSSNPLLKMFTILSVAVIVMYFTQETLYLGLIILYLLASIYIHKESDLSLIAVFRKLEIPADSNKLNSLASPVVNYFLIVSLFFFMLHVFDFATTNIVYILIIIQFPLVLIARKVKSQ